LQSCGDEVRSMASESDQVEVFGMPVKVSEFSREVELRCPTGPRKLFAKLRMTGEQPVVTSDNLVEMACQDCRRRLRSEGRDIALVLHRFNIVGDLIETVAVDREIDTA
jgi:hypothetical protein